MIIQLVERMIQI